MKFSKAVKDTFIISWIKSYPDFKRNPLTLVLVVVISSAPLFFMALGGGQNAVVNGLIGAMVSSVAFRGVTAGITDIYWDRYVKIREMITAMPVAPASYALGVALAPLIISVPSLIFFGVLAAYLGFLTLNALMMVVVSLIVVWAAVSTMGFMISTYLLKSSWVVLNNLSTLLGLIVIFIPPVYYSEAQLGALSWLSIIVPTSNVAGLMRSYMGLLPLPMSVVLIRWLVLAATTIFFIALTIRKARWQEK